MNQNQGRCGLYVSRAARPRSSAPAGKGENPPAAKDITSIFPVPAAVPMHFARFFALHFAFFFPGLFVAAAIIFLALHRAFPLLANPNDMGHPAVAAFFQYHEISSFRVNAISYDISG
jgi:hypothetical protein